MKAEFPLCFRRGKAVLLPSPSREHPPRNAAASDAGPGGGHHAPQHPTPRGDLQVKSEPGLGISPGGISPAVSFTALTPGYSRC